METYLFWTGGWDSTFRLLQLAEMGVEVNPVYIRDSKRKSSPVEIERMNEIASEVNTRNTIGGGGRWKDCSSSDCR